MEIQAKIGQRIKEIRTEKNLTQEAVAFKAEIDRTFMNHVENGKRNVSIETLFKIITAGLDSSFAEFFSSSDFHQKKKSGGAR